MEDKKEIKPILVIKLPMSSSMQMVVQSERYVKQKGIENDYHVLIVNGGENKETKIEVFYDKDIKETDIEELKKMIHENLKSLSNNEKI